MTDETTPPPEPTSSVPEEAPADRFGGAPVQPAPPAQAAQPTPPPKKGGSGKITCLILTLLIVGGAVFGLIVIVGLIGSVFDTIQPDFPHVTPSNKTVALLRIDEPIFEGQRFMKVFEHYLQQDDIRALLVRINSPGGTVGASQELYEGIRRMRARGCKVVVSMGSVAASGGYYTATAADKVFSNPGAMTGSIGVIMSLPQFRKLADKVGVDAVVVKSGALKDVPSTMRPLEPHERAYLQSLINDAYEQFVQAILDTRRTQLDEAYGRITRGEVKLDFELPDTVNDGESLLRFIADGRVVTGRQAKALGLVDELGGKREALEAVAKMAGIRGEPEIYEYKPKMSLIEMLQTEASSAVQSMPMPIQGARLEYRMHF